MKAPHSFKKTCWLSLACSFLALLFSNAAFSEKHTALITAIQGSVIVNRPGTAAPVVISRAGVGINIADTVETEAGSVQIQLADKSLVTLSPRSAARISHFSHNPEQNRRAAYVNVLRGKVRFVIYQKSSNDSMFRVETPTAVVTAPGIADFVVDVGPISTSIMTLKHVVYVKSNLQLIIGEVRLSENQAINVGEKKAPDLPHIIENKTKKVILRQFIY